MSSRDSRDLASAAAEGDEDALRSLLERYLTDVRAFVRLRAGGELREHESRSDIVQSICREILQHGARFRHPSENAFRRWLFTTALRKIQNRRRFWVAEKREPGRAVDEAETSADGPLLERYATFATPSRDAILNEQVERVEAAFDELSDEHREVITLAHIIGLSRSEIAEQTGRSEEAVRSLLHRAMVRLSAVMTKKPS